MITISTFALTILLGWLSGVFKSLRRKPELKVVILDSFGRQFRCTSKVDHVSLEGARRYNPKFGTTLSELQGATQLIELRMDQHGDLMDTSVNHINSLDSQAL